MFGMNGMNRYWCRRFGRGRVICISTAAFTCECTRYGEFQDLGMY